MTARRTRKRQRTAGCRRTHLQDDPIAQHALFGSPARGRVRSRGLTLLEVILAIAILGGCIAVIGELVRIGVRHAEEARETTKAQLLCESKLEEIAAGAAPLESVASAPLETDSRWLYTVSVAALDRPELLEVRVTVQQSESIRTYPISVTLVRWIIDPTLLEMMEEGDLPEEGEMSEDSEAGVEQTTEQTGTEQSGAATDGR